MRWLCGRKDGKWKQRGSEEKRQNPRREGIPGPQKSSAVAGTTTLQWAQKEFRSLRAPFNSVTLPKTEKKLRRDIGT